MFAIFQFTSPYGSLLCIVIALTSLTLHTLSGQPPTRKNILSIQSIKRCLHNEIYPDNLSVTHVRPPSGISQTTPRDCRSVFRHLLMSYRSYVSAKPSLQSSPPLRYDVHSETQIPNFHIPVDLLHFFLGFGLSPDDVVQLRMTSMWTMFNDIMRSGERRQQTVQPLEANGEGFSEHVFWDTPLKRKHSTTMVPVIPSSFLAKNRRKRDVEHSVESSGDFEIKRRDLQLTSGAQKRAYGSWYDVIRQRRHQVLSVNNALATLSDMLLEHRRNRLLRNRERLRYYMMREG
ncbi:uncharacterized protein LOC129923793 [Biomphalaria glabrata]|uniref:Uncharacterized protein LOC129923793 n=1 Tax=Biomphalaria glabrata TaxID=6526 RepID=A0A9W2ZC55_BIOGL|nr:uncharacterized protein LOC129923793 [Biomphalaria glabrata]XP_055872481.1 uncharacterized protein LOC129923793 [Biomphalaria glabrata]